MIRRIVIVNLILAMIEAGIGFYYQFPFFAHRNGQLPQEFSLFRLIVSLVFFVLVVVIGILVYKTWYKPDLTEQLVKSISNSPQKMLRISWVSGTGIAVCTTILLAPSYFWGSLNGYVERSLPLIGWAELMIIQVVASYWFWKMVSNEDKKKGILQREVLLPSGVIFSLFVLIIIVIARTGIGIIPPGRTPFYTGGVPLLPGQVWFMICLTIILGVSGVYLIKRYSNSRVNVDLVIGLVIWGITAILWMSAPLPRSFFFPGPYPPNNSIYPYADSATWDTGSHYALIGLGFDNGNAFSDHAGWMGVLSLMHLLVGDNYTAISIILAGLQAIFPALMYWLGKSMHSRLAGFFIAGLAAFHELNAFAASNMINLSHARFLLTEYPARICLAVLAILLFTWFRSSKQNIAYAIPVGGISAFLILLRFNTLVFPFAVLAGVFLIFGRDWKGSFKASILLGVSLLLVLSPWMLRSWTISGTPFFFSEKTNLLFKENFRIKPSITPTPSSSDSYHESEPTSPVQLIRGATSSNLFSNEGIPSPKTVISTSTPGLMLAHFVHNLVISVLILPTSLTFDDVEHTIYEVHNFWDKMGGVWAGELTLLEAILLLINVFLLSLGLGVTWEKWKLAGLIPLGVFIAYNVSLAVARTSGGRYIVPMDWVILLYWGVGITYLALRIATQFGMDTTEATPRDIFGEISMRQGWLSLLPFLLFMGIMLVMDKAIPADNTSSDKTAIFNILKERNIFQKSDITEQQLSVFMAKKNTIAFLGRALYPRFYGMGQGEFSGGIDAYEPANYPRLAFTIIGKFDKRDVILAWMIQDLPAMRDIHFPDSSDVIVIGCRREPRSMKTKTIVDALVIVLLEDKPVVYVRNPRGRLNCPMPPPACSSNTNCK